ncbi:arginine--tRNA ligase [Patescibacteria group bacterium]|nr:arginine--tRNA ligase [Patescibacteria group bacterium]
MKVTIEQALRKVLADLGAADVTFVVERPGDMSHGDYAANAALVASKALGRPPRDIAESLKVKLEEAPIPGVATVTVAGPGFINITLERERFSDTLSLIASAGPEWGANDSWAGKRVVVEYTDPNPFKELHIGHLFTNAVGESIARLFMMNGANVKRVNYQGDVGLHVAHALYGMQQLGMTPTSNFGARELGRAYALGATTYKQDEVAAAAIRELNKRIYDRTDATINDLYDAGRRVSLTYFETIYTMVGTRFDEYFYESEAGPRGLELVHSHPDIFPESNGARIFKGEEHGLHTRVFQNHEGLPTYEAKELALAKMKEERLGIYDHSVISTSNEITEYFKVLKCAMGFIYPELAAKTEHLGHGTVRLATGKMSSRTGDVIPALDFINEVAEAALEKMIAVGAINPDRDTATQVAIAAIKFVTLHGSILQDSVFDKERALSFEGDSGPYLQYTHARIHSVMEKATAAGISPSTRNAPEAPYEVERLLGYFPEVIASALKDRAPHQVVTYLTELAGSFNSFYSSERIADKDDEYAPYKLALADAVRTTLKNGLWVLGIPAPEKM